MLSIVKVVFTMFILFATHAIGKRSGNLRGRIPQSDGYNSKSVIISFDAACHLEVDQKMSILQELFPCILPRGLKHNLDSGSFVVLDVVGDDSCLGNTEIDYDEYCIADVEYESVYNITGCSYQNLQSGMPYGYSWSLDKLDKTVDNQFYYMSGSSVVDIYILDTGVQTNHVEFGGRVINLDTSYTNITGSHGTHVAGISGGTNYGVSRGLKIYSYNVCRYFYSDGSVGCGGGDIFEGLRQVLNRLTSTGRKGVINLSLGGPVSSGVDTKYDDYFKQLNAVGGFAVVAAGNANVDACTYAPAKCTYAISVGSYSSSYSKSSFSNYGSCVATWAPGERIPSSIWQSNAYNDKYAYMSGTSMATPHITGLVANLLTANPSLTLSGIKSALASNSFNVGSCTSGSTCKGAYYSCVSTTTAALADVTTTTEPTTSETKCCGGRRYCAVWDSDLTTCETIKDCRIVTSCD